MPVASKNSEPATLRLTLLSDISLSITKIVCLFEFTPYLFHNHCLVKQTDNKSVEMEKDGRSRRAAVHSCANFCFFHTAFRSFWYFVVQFLAFLLIF